MKAKTVTDQAERTKLYEQAQVIFKEQAPWFTIAHAVQLKPVRKEVVDFKLSPFGRHTFYGVDLEELTGGHRSDAAAPRRAPVRPSRRGMLRFVLTRLSLVVPTFIGITLWPSS